MLVHRLRKQFVEVINDHFKKTFGRIVHFEKTHEERSGKKSCCTFWQTHLSSFVLASACLQNTCGIRIVLREPARKYFTAVRSLVCSKTMKRCIKRPSTFLKIMTSRFALGHYFLRRPRGSGIILYLKDLRFFVEDYFQSPWRTAQSQGLLLHLYPVILLNEYDHRILALLKQQRKRPENCIFIIHLDIYGLTTDPHNDQLQVGLITQPVEHCSGIVEVRVGSNPRSGLKVSDLSRCCLK